MADLWAVVDGSIDDALVDRISVDLRFSAAYDAALALANLALRCAGYRTRGVAHHATAFETLPMVMGEGVRGQANLFEACRVKRNVGHYRRRGGVTPQELAELIETVQQFRDSVREWMGQRYPQYVPQAEGK